MRWPWSKREKRDSGGDFADAVVRLIEAQAAGTAADASSTAAVEAAAGALSRAFASAQVVGDAWIQDAVSPAFLAQVGRDVIRKGDSLHAIRVGADGAVRLIPCSSWHWEGSHDPSTWTVRVTAYGPSTSTTWNLPASAVAFVRWGSNPGQPYIGTAPTSWAHTTARLGAEVERSVADEAAGPLAQLLAVPEGQDAGSDEGDDPLAPLRADIAKARGRALLLETTASGFGEGRANAPQRDWDARRLGPAPPEVLAQLRRDAFEHVLAACGTPASLFTDADGTAQREAVRRWHLGTVLPLARLVEHELTEKLETPVQLRFDSYALDMVSRATVIDKLVRAGIVPAVAMAVAGIVVPDEDDDG